MIADFAIDTNIAFYALSEGPKSDKALLLLKEGPYISVQLLNEFANASKRKRNLPWAEIEESLAIIGSLATDIRPVDTEVHRLGRSIAQRYKLSFYDALIIAAALLDECEVFYSEDMQDGLVIEGRMTITNPFLAAS